jgi:hypothetical protein
VREELVALATAVRGRVYAVAEELDHEDALLEQVDELYRKVGLRRYRRIWLGFLPGRSEAAAALIAYRGPLGFNFSFLENRLDLLVRPEVSEEDASAVIRSLLCAAAPLYADFAPGRMLVTCDDRCRPLLERLGGQFIRQYAQSIWLKEGYIGWYRHVEKFYERIMKAEHRRGLGSRRASAAESNIQPGAPS